MNWFGWMFFALFVAMAGVNAHTQSRLDAAKADLGALMAFHNGFVAGRGCEVPE